MDLFNPRIIPFPLPRASSTPLETGQLSHSENTFIQNTTFPSVQLDEFLGLYFNLGKKVGFTANGVSGNIDTCQYNFIYLPKSAVQVEVQPGTCESLWIHFPLPYLQDLEESFPILKRLLKHAKLKVPGAVSSNPIRCKAGILDEIDYLLGNDLTTQALDHPVAAEYIWGKVCGILMSCLTDLSANANQPLARETDRQKVELAKAYLLDHMTERFSADRIAEKVGMEKHKLRVAFKMMYHCSMQTFLIDTRLEKARSLLLNTDLSIEKIGMAIGIKKLSNFSDFFKKKYGYSPRVLRESFAEGRDKKGV